MGEVEGFEVDVARLILDREQHDHVQQFADRGSIREFRFSSEVVPACRRFAFVVFLQLADDVFDALFFVGVVPPDSIFDVFQI